MVGCGALVWYGAGEMEEERYAAEVVVLLSAAVLALIFVFGVDIVLDVLL